MLNRQTSVTVAQWLVLLFLFAVVSAGIWFGRDDPRTPWGPIILGAFGLMGLVVRSLFRVSPNDQDDGYGR